MGAKVTAGSKGYSAEITVTGLVELRAAMKEFEPELLKRMDATIKTAAKTVQGRAQSLFPGTHGAAYRISSRSRGKKVGMSIAAIGGSHAPNDWSRPGTLAAILEFFGKVQPGKTARARAVTATLNARYGHPGRFLWRAWDEEKATVIPAIEGAVRSAEAELQARID